MVGPCRFRVEQHDHEVECACERVKRRSLYDWPLELMIDQDLGAEPKGGLEHEPAKFSHHRSSVRSIGRFNGQSRTFKACNGSVGQEID